MTAPISLKGCFPPIPTPFDARGRLDHDRLASNLESWRRTPLAGIVALGSNGEAVLLREEEKLELWKTVSDGVGEKLFIAGTGCEATSETLNLTEKAARLGAKAAMIVTPCYYKSRMDHRALVNHYSFVADRSPVPVILYNVPAFTGIDLSAETVIELAGHPNIVGLKESSGNVAKIGQIVRASEGQEFQVLAGSGSFLLPALTVGAVGGVMALASVTPFLLDEILKTFEQGDLKKAREVQLRLIAPNAAVTSRFGIPGLKAALDLIGLYGGPVRPPLAPLSEDQGMQLKRILSEAGIYTLS